MSHLVYLASPYTHPSKAIRLARTRAVAKLAAKLVLKRKVMIICPVVHGHHIDYNSNGNIPYAYWIELSFALLARCQSLYVAMIPGWYQSNGIKLEIGEARRLEMPILYVDPHRGNLVEEPINVSE